MKCNAENVIYSSNSDEWETPYDVFERLNEEFHFTLDPCATVTNAKCEKFYSKQENGLEKNWGGEKVFCNPPYSEVAKWAKKAYEESKKPETVVVLLVPSRTDTRWFHDYVYHHAEIRFVRGRLKFSNTKSNAPFPSMIAIFGDKRDVTVQQLKDLGYGLGEKPRTDGDCISRQAAIAVADSSDYVGLSVEDVKKVTDLVVKGLKRLPSAQPDRSLWFRIGEICVDESKGFISADRAVEKIRELLRKAERGWEE